MEHTGNVCVGERESPGLLLLLLQFLLALPSFFLYSCRGSTAVLKEINVDNFCATIVIDKGPQSGRELVGVEYEDVCKIADAK